MRVLVTGGAGYIGSVVAEELVKGGHEVVVYDNLYKGHRAAVSPHAKFVEGDLLDGERLRRTLAENSVEAVIHMAADSLVRESVTDREIPVRTGPRRPGDPAVLVAGSEKIRRELGWRPELQDLRAIVASAWGWMQKNPQGYST